ncbi:hypothetical protein [Natranaerobius trueperi]|uniref:Uncharacterized protein n=1 Tax=Natranaerobius trueperi TaxID=759412 RepID=A0A226C004_9FIRM|nr:hypothetical protein [Natranaerobius trueperi]OWZ83924.1 hypothetical protein CDO51_05930 [Natranaerobius trueperi]
MSFLGAVSRKKTSLRSKLNKKSIRRKPRRKSTYNKEELSITSRWIKEMHHDLPRKIVVSILIFLMLYFTSQINQPWSQSIMSFVHRITTQQPDYSQVVRTIKEDYEFYDQFDIVPVIGDDKEEERF